MFIQLVPSPTWIYIVEYEPQNNEGADVRPST